MGILLNPSNTDYIFFVADKTGKVYFTKSNGEHEAVIRDLINKGLHIGKEENIPVIIASLNIDKISKEEYKELESEIAANPKLLDEFYRRFRVIRDPESTLQTFSEAFTPW